MNIKRNKNGKYVLDYYIKVDGVLKRREETYPTKKLAELAMAKRKVQLAENRFLDKAKVAPVATFEELAENYLAWAKDNKRSWSRDELSMKYLSGFFGQKTLSEVAPFLVEGYKQHRKSQVSPLTKRPINLRTINIELALLRFMLNKAAEWGLYQEQNPFNSVRLFKVNNERNRYLTEAEITALIDAAEDYFRPTIITAIWTGLRRSELLNLKWSDLDFEHGIIHVATLKGGERRDMPMSDYLRRTLEQLHRQTVPEKLEWVFLTRDGTKPLRDVRRPFTKALRRAGIANCRWHDLRHTFASHLVMNGVDLKTVQELMGHKTFAMTLRYSHLSPAHKRDAVKVMDSIGRFRNGDILETLPGMANLPTG